MSIIPVISREMDLTEYKGIAPGKSRRISVFPDNATTYNSSSSTADVFFSIPAVRNGFCVTSASQIVFDVTANATFTIDPNLSLSNGTGSSLIQALETVVQNQSVENILNYNVYADLLADLQPLGRSVTVGSIVAGSAATLKAGVKLNSATTGADGITIRCSLPLHSAVLGTGAEQFAPMVDGIRLRMTMAATDVGLTYGSVGGVTAAQYKISNFAIQLEVMDLDAATMGALISQSGGVLKQHCAGVNNYQSTIAVATANSVLIPARFSSVKALLTTFRLAANLAAPQQRNVPGDRIQPAIASYLWNVDGQNIPSVPVRVASAAANQYPGEVLSEVMKTFSASNQTAFDCVFNAAQFTDILGTAGTGSFFLSNNFESMDSAGHALMSGRDLNASNVYLNLSHYANPAGVCVCDTFAIYDLVLSYNMADGSVSMSK